MSKEEIIQKILSDAAEQRAAIDKTIGEVKSDIVQLNVRRFENLMMNIIKYKWSVQYSDAFFICYVIGPDYDTCPSAPYSWYMAVVNGRLDKFMEINCLTDAHMYCSSDGYETARVEILKRRLDIAEQLLLSDDDILVWCFRNVDVK